MAKPLAVYKCANCGCDVEIYHRARLGREVCCSTKCMGEYRKRKHIEQHRENIKICVQCGKEYYCKPYHARKHNSRFCSRKCFYEWKKVGFSGKNNHQYGLKGSKNASWKSDEKISVYGYKLIRVLDHPFRNGDDFVFEHRLIAEKYLLNEENSIEINGKRYLKPDLIVHHIDHNRLNNSVDNLAIYTRAEHTRLHAQHLI